MSERDDFNSFMKEMDDYNRLQLRQTLELYKELSNAFVIKDDPEAIIEKFDNGIKSSITGTG